MSDPTVTVITATYNRERSLELTLQSLLGQDLPDFEAWVIGDACTDGSERLVASFRDPRLHWFNRETNSGHQSDPNNDGLQRARGRYVAYLAHDDLWLPWHLSSMVAAIENLRADWLHAFCAMIGPEGARWAIGAPPPGRDYSTHSVPPSSWMHRRDLVSQVGGWRHYSTLGDPVDFDLLKRLGRAGARLAFLPELTVLKFPSWEYPGIYKLKGDPPHASYLERMSANPHQLQSDLYRDISLSLARFHARRADAPRLAMQQLVKAVGARTSLLWGEHRWPVSSYRRWEFQRRLARTRRKRGL